VEEGSTREGWNQKKGVTKEGNDKISMVLDKLEVSEKGSEVKTGTGLNIFKRYNRCSYSNCIYPSSAKLS